MKNYLAEYSYKDGTILYKIEIEAENLQEAKFKAQIKKKYNIPYQGPGKLKTHVKLKR